MFLDLKVKVDFCVEKGTDFREELLAGLAYLICLDITFCDVFDDIHYYDSANIV